MRACCAFLALLGALASARADEQIFISGGPALRFFERSKRNSHDVYWGNFIDAGLARFKEIQPEIRPGDTLTWLVFRPAYASRGGEQQTDLLAEVEKKIAPTGARLVWFDNREGLIRYLNQGMPRDEVKIARLEYFGHSNKRCWMFDYSNTLDGGSAEIYVLHMNDLAAIKRGIFSSQAYCQSWGCHSGEQYSSVWRTKLGVPLVGAIGKTDYSRGGLPILSTPQGRWSQ
jgi:hypothetical protein